MFGMPLRACHRSSHVLSVGGTLFLLCMICCRVEASGRASSEVAKPSAARGESAVRAVAASERPLAVGYSVGRQNTTVSLTNADTRYEYKVLTGHESALKPESFVRMWGTRDGMAALARALGDMLAGDNVNIRRVNVGIGGLRGPVEAAAVFDDDQVTHLLLVRFEGDTPVFEELAVAAVGCVATPQGGTCSCTATGADAKCTTGIYQTGVYWARCRDSSGAMECTWNGSMCGCTAAQ